MNQISFPSFKKLLTSSLEKTYKLSYVSFKHYYYELSLQLFLVGKLNNQYHLTQNLSNLQTSLINFKHSNHKSLTHTFNESYIKSKTKDTSQNSLALDSFNPNSSPDMLTTTNPILYEKDLYLKEAPSLRYKRPKPKWHPPWNNYRVITGHKGWVRSLSFDQSNAWFCTGSSDRTIKIWDAHSGELKLTLMGHIEQVTGLVVSHRNPYLFSCGLDKTVKCWDLTMNKVIRSYHGHLSGVYCLSIHPTLDLLFSAGRDSVCRVWDIRTKEQIYCLSGHEDNIGSILTRSLDPQVITGSHDGSIRFWDLRTGKSFKTLNFNKKGIKALVLHPKENSFSSASSENIKMISLPDGILIG